MTHLPEFQSLHLQTLSTPSRNEIDAAARSLRTELADRGRARFVRDYDEQSCEALIGASSLINHVSTFPADNGLRVLSFSLFLTKLAIDHLIKTERDPARLVFVGARIAELGMYSFQDPNTGASLPDYLGASKEIGYFFTPPEVAMLIARAAIGDRKKIDHVLDPAAGTGSLLAATMLVAAERKANIAAVTGIEADKFTAKLANRLLSQQRKLLGIECKLRIENGDAIQLLNDQTRPVTSDCIVMNPPYGRVKFLRSSLTNAETRITARHVELDELAKQRQAKAASQASTFRSLSAELGLGAGPQDYQRVFTGLALKVLTVSGRLAIITPSSWLGDRDALQLRKQVLGKKLLREVILFPEDSGLFATVNQPTAIAVFEKSPGQESFSVEMLEGRTLKVGDAYDVAYKSIDKHDPAMMRVPRLSGRLYHILEKLQDFPRIQDLTEIRNARGELDLTLGKEWIQAAESSLRLIRGDHLERYVLRPASYSKQPSYINLARFEDSVIGAKVSDTYKHRLAGRQCSYLKKGRRLSFAWVPPRAILGNSCNYLCSRSDTERTPRLEAILTILNSSVVEWYFRTFNSNNHVANYEIDDLPVCLDNALTENALARASEFLTNEYCSLSDGGRVPLPIEDVADALVAFGFGLTGEETSLVLKAVRPEASLRVTNMVEALHRDGIGAQFTAGQGWYQHESPALSKLDRDVIHFVPQGGNWQSVPESIPSKRLEQIREMTAERGVVRTTYYGRLRPDQPSYTIATYFNRPGNGTNIHPWEDRTLTSREAARLQSFEDSYVFLGTATSARKQIGNAVPSLLAEAIGAQLSPRTRSHDAIELFCGAGGLSLGLERAGWKMLAAIDNDKHALQTYGFNRPSEARPTNRDTHTLVIPADLHDKEVRQQCLSAIRTKLSGGTPALLAGGPPCQGFSHAGWRLEGDKRNDLAVVFMSFVKELQPEVVLLENVEGLLSYDGGKVLQDLLLTFRDLGYDTGTSPWVLSAEQFGVPQMRRRVFLVGLRNGRSSISPPPPRFMKCLGRRELQDAPNLLQEAPYPITAAEALYDLLPLGPRVHTSMGLRRVRPYYAQWCRGEIDTKQLVELSAAEPLEADRVSHSSLEDPLELSA